MIESTTVKVLDSGIFILSCTIFAMLVLLVLNHAEGVDGIRGLPRHGTDTECRMESAKGGMESRTKGNEGYSLRLMPCADEPRFHTTRGAR